MPAMTTLLRRHGAVLVERHGAPVAAHFGSAQTEAAVCRTSVGLAARSDRATFEVHGAPAAVDEALSGLVPLGDRVHPARVTPGLALVRCEGEDAETCRAHLDRSEGASVLRLAGEYVALELIGPLAGEVFEAAGAGMGDDPVVVVREDARRIELLVPATHGPALWHRLLEAGEPYEIACVGLDALEHLAASEHLGAAAR